MTKEPVCGNGPALSRRTLLTATGAAAFIPHRPQAATPTIMEMYHEWESIVAYLNEFDDCDEVLVERLNQLEEEILLQPGKTASDLAAKLAVNTCWGDFALPSRREGRAAQFWGEVENLLSMRTTPSD